MELDAAPPIAKYLSLIYFVSRLGSQLVWFFLPIFFKQNIESVFLIGILTSLPAATPILLDIPVGNLVQRAGEKIVIFLGLLMYLMPPLLYLTGLPFLLVFGKIFEGVTKTMVWNGGWSLSLRSSDEETESESVAVFLLGANLAAIIGPVMGGYLIATRGFPLTFALWVFTAWLAVLVFYMYVGLEGKKPFVKSVEDLLHRRTYIDDYRHLKENWSSLRYPFLLMFTYSIIFSFFWLAVPLLLEKVGAGFEVMGIIFGLAAAPRIFQFVFGEIADRIGKLKLTALIGVLLTPVLAAMASVSGVYALGGLFLVARLLASGFSPALHAFYDSRVPDEIEGEMTGFMELVKHSGQTLGPMIAGTAASIWTINASFHAAAAICLGLSIAAAAGALRE